MTIASDDFETLNAPSSAIEGWSVTSNSIDWIKGYWQPAAGDFSLDMSGTAPGTIVSQNLATIPGQLYRLDFDMAGNPAGLPSLKTLEVSAGTANQTFTFDTTGKSLTGLPGMGWTEMTMEFTATSDMTTLTFASLTNGSYGPGLDNVSVVAVPEPSRLFGLLSLAGMGLVGLVWRRRK